MIINLKTSDMNDLQIKLELDVDPELYPYLPPKIKYISPNAKRSFVYNLSNMSILEIQNWNPTISFDWLITNIGINIDKLKEEYIEKNSEIELRPIDCLLIEFNSLIGEKIYTDIDLNFDYVKFSLTKSSSNQENKYWNSGVGYGYTGRDQWDIKKYVKDRELKNKNMIKILKKH